MHIPSGYSEASLNFTSSDLPNGATITLGLENPLDDDPVTVGAALRTAFEAQVLPGFPGRVGLDTIKIKNGPNATGPDAVIFSGTPGGGDGTNVVPNVAMIMRKFTALGGRKARGRWYLPIANETNLENGGNLNTSYVANMQGRCNSFLADMIAAGYVPSLLHADSVTPPYALTTFVGETVIATQRRRTGR